MAKIIGNTTATPNPRPDWDQTDETKADYIKNKPTLGALAAKDTVDKTDLEVDVQQSLEKVENAVTIQNNGSVEVHDTSSADGDHSFAGGLNNIAYSRDAFVGGFGNIAGGKGFKIIGQGAGEMEGEGYYDLTSVDGIEVGQNYIVRLSSVSANISGEITDISGNRVYVNNYDPALVIEREGGNNPEANQDISRAASDTNYLCIVGHPELGDVSVGFNAIVFGENSIATERSSASFGRQNKSLGQYSFTEGYGTIAIGDNQHVQGIYNIADAKYAHIIGNGSVDDTGKITRSTAHTVDWDGNAWYKGKVKVGGTSYDNASEVATQDFVIAKIKEVLDSFINVSEEGA